MKKRIELSKPQIKKIKELANKIRKEAGVFSDAAIADDLLGYLENEGIIVCYYPFKDGERIDANITIFHTDPPIKFIGLNSNLYYDEQLFALAHELYHYITESGLAYSENDMLDARIEQMADRFAAELLLPESVLKDRVESSFPDEKTENISELRVLRFIAQLQIEWWLPYRSVLLRLKEEGLLPETIVGKLFNIDHRAENSSYSRIFKNINPEIYNLLNSKSKKIGISRNILEIFVRNYEDGYIEEDEFVKLLSIFNKKPSDFGFDVEVIIDDDLRKILKEWENEG